MSTVIIDWKRLKQTIPYSRQHIKRLEDEGKFPVRVQLGEHRVGWILDEVEGWVARRVRERDERSP